MRKLKGLKPLKINSDLAHIASNNLYEATSNGSDSVEFTEDALRGQLDKITLLIKQLLKMLVMRLMMYQH